jgi:hypothetical protein
MRRVVVIVAAATAVFSNSAFAAGSDPQVSTAQIVGLTKFLEEQPRDEHAPAIRALMLDWEDKTKDVVDYVCPGVLAPVPDKGVPNGPELAAQFIFGSAAFQIANPSQKGALQPSQLAGMRSMLKVYRVFLASDPKARLPRFDELVAKEADGSLPAYLKPVVATECKQ